MVDWDIIITIEWITVNCCKQRFEESLMEEGYNVCMYFNINQSSSQQFYINYMDKKMKINNQNCWGGGGCMMFKDKHSLYKKHNSKLIF